MPSLYRQQLEADARYGDVNAAARLLLDDARRGVIYLPDVCRPVIDYPLRHDHNFTTCILRNGMLGSRDYKQCNNMVCRTIFWNGYHLSTVYLSIDHSYDGPAIIFETMLFGPDDFSERLCYRYNNETEARIGHQHLEQQINSLHHRYREGTILNLDEAYQGINCDD